MAQSIQERIADGEARRAEITALNEELEQCVAERTADLQDMVSGLESFNRTVSHDLRGPLTGIGSLAQLLIEALERGDGSLARKFLPVIAKQSGTTTYMLRPVFVNLNGNAVKLMAQSKAACIEIGVQPQTGENLIIYVRDNGPGFQPEASDKLFKPFVRLHGATYTGHGVGLSIVRRAWPGERPSTSRCRIQARQTRCCDVTRHTPR